MRPLLDAALFKGGWHRDDGVHAIDQIASCRPHAIAYGCTASSIVQAHAFDERLRTEIRHIAKIPEPRLSASCNRRSDRRTGCQVGQF